MRNPLLKRIPHELKEEWGKYAVIFLFLIIMISCVSGFLVASNSMLAAYDESFEKYNIEDGNFALSEQADEALLEELENEKVTVYENFYIEEKTTEVDSKLRIYKNREDVDKICLMSGEFPQNAEEIAIDRMYADNNDLSIGDTLTVGGKTLKITGLVAFSDYSALFSDVSDMMFDAVKFGTAVVTDECFAEFGTDNLHYSYAWVYDNPPVDDSEAKEMSEDFLKTLVEQAAYAQNAVTAFVPEYLNQAILFAGDDLAGDNSAMTVFLYIVVVMVAFIFAITSSNTISKEANVIGTLRATGYTKGELVRHYLTMPVLVMLLSAIVGNILGYTVFKWIAAAMYYNSYSLPTYVTLWNADAFLKTTVIPLILMFVINLFVLLYKLSLSPLQFIRRDLVRRKNKKALRLNTKIRIMKRFRLRIILQNIPNYITVFVGVAFANLILMFGFMFTPLLDHFQEEITSNLLSEYQYVLKTQNETETAGAEKYCIETMKTIEGKLKSESVSVYGIQDNSSYVELSLDGDEVAVSNAFAEKFGLKAGESITLQEEYGDKEYTFEIGNIYYYPAGIAVFMNRDSFNRMMENDDDYFNGYFSDNEITDIEASSIATVITVDDLTKTSRQLKTSMGSMTLLYLIFGIAMFMMMIFLLSKIIIEKNAQSISMTKILGYSNNEISNLYILSTTIIVILCLLVTIPLVAVLLQKLCVAIFADYSGWLEYYVPFSTYIKIFILGIASYAVIAFLLMKKIRRIPLSDALKNVE
jgi:putative ABC transport system permease protein